MFSDTFDVFNNHLGPGMYQTPSKTGQLVDFCSISKTVNLPLCSAFRNALYSLQRCAKESRPCITVSPGVPGSSSVDHQVGTVGTVGATRMMAFPLCCFMGLRKFRWLENSNKKSILPKWW